jgi:hypothetical protein
MATAVRQRGAKSTQQREQSGDGWVGGWPESAKELRPGRSASPGSRTQAVGLEHPADGGGSDRDAELAELALDAHVSPPGVVPGQPEDCLAKPGIDWRAAHPGPPVGPLAPHQLAVPPEQGLGGDEERPPTLARQGPGGCGEERPVCRTEPRTADLAAENPELVAEDGDLDVLRGILRAGSEPEEAAQQQVQDRQKHEALILPMGPAQRANPSSGTLHARSAELRIPRLSASKTRATNLAPLDVRAICAVLGQPAFLVRFRPVLKAGAPVGPFLAMYLGGDEAEFMEPFPEQVLLALYRPVILDQTLGAGQ